VAAVQPGVGEHVLDLYAGVGAFSATLAGAVGPAGAVLGLEAAPAAVADAAENLSDLPWATVRLARVSPMSIGEASTATDVVVLDPPRAGAGPGVMAAIMALQPRAVGYVSCDPATLARDIAVAAEAGWRLASLRAFDAFPMTQHIECVAALRPPTGNPAP
jgi:tRNA/tmRNA/rRNA uracil-C5-methylase (TrmA/RlmC/RlmD family)